MHCKFVEPKDTKHSQIHSANSKSPSFITPEQDSDMFKNSVDTFINITRMLLIAESKSESASAGLFLQTTTQSESKHQNEISTTL